MNLAGGDLAKAVSQLKTTMDAQSQLLESIWNHVHGVPAPSPDSSQATATSTAPMTTDCSDAADDAWQKIKAAVYASEGMESPIHEDESSEPPAVPVSTPAVEPAEGILPELPALVPADDIDDCDLREAMVERDRIIGLLARHLRDRSTRSLSPDDLVALRDSAPESLAEAIDEGLSVLDRQVRVGELEMSLERARVARQVSTLEATRERLDHAARQFGMRLLEDGTLDGELKVPEEGSRGRRWLNALGFS